MNLRGLDQMSSRIIYSVFLIVYFPMFPNVGFQVGEPVAFVRAICTVEQPLEGMGALHVVDNNPLGGS